MMGAGKMEYRDSTLIILTYIVGVVTETNKSIPEIHGLYGIVRYRVTEHALFDCDNKMHAQ